MLISSTGPPPLPSGHQSHPKTCPVITVDLIDLCNINIYVWLGIPKSALSAANSLLVGAHFQQPSGHLYLEVP